MKRFVADMTLEAFRKKVNEYRRAVGITQKKLARDMGLHPTVLSHKFHETDGMRLIVPEVKQMIRLLAGWQALATRADVADLLDELDLRPTIFSDEEWSAPPLNALEGEIRSQPAAVTAPELNPSIPIPTTPLIGRAELLESMRARMADPAVRLLTLTGTGGIGKTRLALEIMRQTRPDYADGVVYVPLASLSDASVVAAEIAHHFQVRARPGDSPLNALKATLAERRTLLVLDNFEHLMDAAPLVVELLEATSYLKILVTSRTLLNLYGEYQVRVPPLALPEPAQFEAPEQLIQQPAVALFVARSQAARHDFALNDANARAVAEICVRLDGLPLALELAAARCRLFSPAALLQRLEQPLALLSGGASSLAPRQRSLRDMIAWSYALLDASEQGLFRVVSAFPAGCTLEALEAVYVPPPGSVRDLLDCVTALLDKSLIERRDTGDDQARFVMLETLREFGLDLLFDSGELDAVRARQAQYYLDWVAALAPEMSGERQVQIADNLETEHDNLRAMLVWMLVNRQAAFMRLTAYLAFFWSVRGYYSEGERWLLQALNFPPPDDAPLDEQMHYIRALNEAGSLAILTGDLKRAQAHLEAAVALARRAGDDRGAASGLILLGDLAWENSQFALSQSFYLDSIAIAQRVGDLRRQAAAYNNLGGVLWVQDNLAEATHYFNLALELWRKLRNKRGIAQTLTNLGIVSEKRQQFEAAMVYYSEGLVIDREIGDERAQGVVLGNMGVIALHQGKYDEALRLHEQGLAIHRSLGYMRGIGLALCNRGTALMLLKRYGEAMASLQEALVIQRELGDLEKLSLTMEYVGVVLTRMGETDQALGYHRQALKLGMDLEDDQAIASSLASIAAALSVQGDVVRAAQLWGRAFSLWDASGVPMLPLDRSRFMPELDAARSATDAATFEAAWQSGEALDVPGLINELQGLPE